MTKRTKYIIATILLLIVEVLIALFINDTFIRPYIGDVLVVVVLYTFIRSFIPERNRLLPLYIFIFAAGVEFLQYFQIVRLLGLENNRFFATLIGTVFDVKDIICYGIGCAILGIYEFLQWKKH